MNKLIDNSLAFLFRLAERLTSECSANNEESEKPSETPPMIRFNKEDNWVQGELFD
ncbi:MAG: hypothetical protein IJ580_02015 [Prevotella sp.]|nr:hypothetical protein [Prevotella sp.]